MDKRAGKSNGRIYVGSIDGSRTARLLLFTDTPWGRKFTIFKKCKAVLVANSLGAFKESSVPRFLIY